MNLKEQIEFIEDLLETCGESAKPRLKDILESLHQLRDLEISKNYK